MFVDGFVFRRDNETVERFDNAGELLTTLELKGCDFFNVAEGEFSFVGLPGGNLGPMVVARDPLGIKPLYYSAAGDSFFFASEIKALIPLGQPVHPFPPGHYWTPRSGFVRYRSPAAEIDRELRENSRDSDLGLTLGDAAATVEELMTEAIARRLPCAERVGILLSGGIDSSVIAAGLSTVLKATGQELVSISIGIPGASDLLSSRTVAEHVGSEHHELECSLEQVFDVLPTVIYELESFDLPLVRSAAVNHLACELAKEYGVRWVYVGEGGDELFAGYPYLKELKDPDLLQRELLRLILTGYKGGFQRVDRMNEAQGLEPLLPFVDMDLLTYSMRLPAEYKIRGNDDLEKWVLREAFSDLLPPEIVWREKEKFFEGSGIGDRISSLVERATRNWEEATSLKKEASLLGVPLRTLEEAYYYRIFREYFPASVVPLVGRTEHV